MSGTVSSDLPVVIYLNQRIVFDQLAIFEDGFSEVTSMQISSAAETDRSRSGEGALGLSNVFALLGISFKGSGSLTSKDTDRTDQSKQKVHTPASLFAKLRQRLREEGLLRNVEDSFMAEHLSSGDFVEFRALLKKSPLLETLQVLKGLLSLSSAFTDPSVRPTGGSNKQKNLPPQPGPVTIKTQIDALLNDLIGSNSVDLIGQIVGASGLSVVLTAEVPYFNDVSMNDCIDGEFCILAKVTRVLRTGSPDSISLLRKATLGRFPQEMIDQMATGIEAANNAGLRFPKLQTELKAPALQAIPIAIFA